MRSFTFNSETGQHERAVPQLNWKKAIIMVAVLAFIGTVCWEMFWRSQDYQPDYDMTKSLWSEFRQKAENADDESIVLFGSSRSVFDIDLPTWWEMKGDKKVIQCSIEGTGPLPIFEDFVQNTDFAGTIVLSVAPGLVFSKHPVFSGFTDQWAQGRIDYYHKWSPAQKSEHQLQLALEPNLAFIESGELDLKALLARIKMEDRKGVMHAPKDPAFFAFHTRHREAKMWDRMLTDTAYCWRVRDAWMGFAAIDAPRMTAQAYRAGIEKNKRGEFRERSKMETWRSGELDSLFIRINENVQQFKKRGGEIIFVRHPSDGGCRPLEAHNFPREKYWDRLLKETGCPGIHFEDHPSLQGYELPEWSHMRADQTPKYTRALVEIIEGL